MQASYSQRLMIDPHHWMYYDSLTSQISSLPVICKANSFCVTQNNRTFILMLSFINEIVCSKDIHFIKFLKFLDLYFFSNLIFTDILKIGNLWCFTNLTKLQLDNNIIEKIEGLELLVHLVWLGKLYLFDDIHLLSTLSRRS